MVKHWLLRWSTPHTYPARRPRRRCLRRVSTQKCLLSQEWSPLSSVDERDHDAPYGAIATAPPLPPQASPHQAWKSNSHLSAHYRVLLFNQSKKKMHAQKQSTVQRHHLVQLNDSHNHFVDDTFRPRRLSPQLSRQTRRFK